MLWKPSQFLLTEDQFAFDTHLENSSTALDEASGRSILLVNFGRQTGGLRRVVSLHAVFDADLHDLSLHSF